MPLCFTVENYQESNASVLRLQGELDFDNRHDFQKAVEELLATERERLAIDFSKVSRMSSVYIGSLVDLTGEVAKKHRKIVVIMNEHLAKICRSAGLEKILQILPAKE